MKPLQRLLVASLLSVSRSETVMYNRDCEFVVVELFEDLQAFAIALQCLIRIALATVDSGNVNKSEGRTSLITAVFRLFENFETLMKIFQGICVATIVGI